MITIVLPYAIPLWNTLRKMKHWEYAKHRRALATEVAVLIPWSQKPRVPFQRARITVERYSIGTPDKDGLAVKSLLDVLQPASTVHPNGIGIIANDNPKCLRQDIMPFRVKNTSLQRTIITIEDLTP